MPPLNLDNWKSVLYRTDRMIGADLHAALQFLRGTDAKTYQRTIYGANGKANLTVEDKMIIKIAVDATVRGEQKNVIATRTSAAHHSRTGHSPWWGAAVFVNLTNDEEYEFETECGCSDEELREDYPRPLVTRFEDNIAGQIGITNNDIPMRNLGNNIAARDNQWHHAGGSRPREQASAKPEPKKVQKQQKNVTAKRAQQNRARAMQGSCGWGFI